MNPYYADDAVTLYHGNALDMLDQLTADVLVTDPPYGIDYHSGHDGALPRSIAGDKDAGARDAVLAWWSDRPAIVFGSWRIARPRDARARLIWEKGGHIGMGDLSIPWRPNDEEVYVLGAGFSGHRGSGILHYNAPVSWNSGPARRLHPHEKPLSLMRELISKCPPGAILDPFAGSGSTLIAARLEGRSAVGVEVDEVWCEVAATRLRDGDVATRGRLAQDVLDFGTTS